MAFAYQTAKILDEVAMMMSSKQIAKQEMLALPLMMMPDEIHHHKSQFRLKYLSSVRTQTIVSSRFLFGHYGITLLSRKSFQLLLLIQSGIIVALRCYVSGFCIVFILVELNVPVPFLQN